MKFALSTKSLIATCAVEIPDIQVKPIPIEALELDVTIPTALVNEFENDSAIVLYMLVVFINRLRQLLDQVKHLVEC